MNELGLERFDCSCMAAHRIIRVGFEEIDLLLEFERVGPVVIAFAEGDVFASGFGEDELLENATFSFRPLIFLMKDGENLIGILFSIFADDFCGAIGRTIIVDDDFDGKIALLHQKTIQTLPDERCVVIGDTAYTD